MQSDPPPIVSTQGQTRWIHLKKKMSHYGIWYETTDCTEDVFVCWFNAGPHASSQKKFYVDILMGQYFFIIEIGVYNHLY